MWACPRLTITWASPAKTAKAGSGYPLQLLAPRASSLWGFRFYPSRKIPPIAPHSFNDLILCSFNFANPSFIA